MTLHIIGIDCAAQAVNIGLALGAHQQGRTAVLDAVGSLSEARLVECLCDWVSDKKRVLIAIDAPLGWPAAMAAQLHLHVAGAALNTDPHSMFRRHTDRFIATHLKKQPLDVGANLIARAAHRALWLLEELRQKLGRPIPLAWKWPETEAVTAIEVYPGALLAVLGMKDVRYKGPQRGRAALLAARRQIVDRLGEDLYVEPVSQALVESDHLLDAALCVLAGADFAMQRAAPPPPGLPVQQEGWIWSRSLPTA